ncbi:MAG: TetR/AcrR family transcriptional regulator C-terminal domain-containing protein, partial [Agathobacter sp.]|nr:TetR/AcrR family transcriptional regulator C-terminal domain-containing protein [Agathobacter sp.]
KQPERTAATRSAFVDAFISISESRPIEKITIQEIADKAGYNRTTFYQYFEDTFHLLSYMEDYIISYIQESIVTRIGRIPAEEKFVQLFTEMYRENNKYLKVLFNSVNYHRFEQKLKRILTPAFEQQIGLTLDNVQADYIIDFYLSGMISIIAKWITSEDLSVEEFAQLVRRIVEGMSKGILTSEMVPPRLQLTRHG